MKNVKTAYPAKKKNFVALYGLTFADKTKVAGKFPGRGFIDKDRVRQY
jgi:hypothetical protein